MKNAGGLPLTERKWNPRLGPEGIGGPHLFGGTSPEESFHHIEPVGGGVGHDSNDTGSHFSQI